MPSTQPNVRSVRRCRRGWRSLWEAACTATEEAGLQYEHARALFCLARHLLTHRLDRSRATTALATARRMAIHLGASPLAGDITILAEQAHVDLLVPDPGESAMVRSTPVLPASPPLTVREREVLDGLLSGETYAQIAARLFISAKTVSSHASSVLRKTGTSSRIEPGGPGAPTPPGRQRLNDVSVRAGQGPGVPDLRVGSRDLRQVS